MKIVVAPDSFKESLDAPTAARAVAEGIRGVMSECEIVTVPLADGGEGMAEVAHYASCVEVDTVAHDPITRPVHVKFYMDKEKKRAYIDMAQASGLSLLTPEERNPLNTSSLGTGDMIRTAIVYYFAKEIVLGVGGSATNDAGLGALDQLDLDLLDKSGKRMGIVPMGWTMAEVGAFRVTRSFKRLISDVKITLACDVDSPFLGPEGAVAVFSPQKGSTPESRELLEKGMENIRDIIKKRWKVDISNMKGAGAGGGLAGVFHVLTGAEIKRGIEIVLEMVDFDAKIADADLIITGEGKSDSQTLLWKTPYGVLQAAKRHDIPVILLSGLVEDSERLLASGFAAVESINEGEDPDLNPLDPQIAYSRLKKHAAAISQKWRRMKS